jgi:CelD/BcsL family acetyltransferase involved in cellulose biosynthesis
MDLETRAEGSFFTTWTWIGGWLATLEVGNPARDSLRLLKARRGDATVALAIIGMGPRTWRTAAHTPLVLNQSGSAQHDAVYIEYNDILVAADDADTVRRACLHHLQSLGGRPRLHIQAAAAPLSAAVATSDIPHRFYRQEACDWIDLEAAHVTDGVLTAESRNTRQQIARAVRRAGEYGPLRLRRAEIVADAEYDLAALTTLHGAAWQTRKGQEGAFGNPVVAGFVTQLVRSGLANGAVDLLRVSAGAQTLGVLLNFVHRGEVYAYQSGFAYTDDNRDKPGLISHALAAAHYKARGARAYHFMAGAARYKASLSNAQETLTWIECYRDNAVTRAEHAAEALWQRLRGPRGLFHR